MSEKGYKRMGEKMQLPGDPAADWSEMERLLVLELEEGHPDLETEEIAPLAARARADMTELGSGGGTSA